MVFVMVLVQPVALENAPAHLGLMLLMNVHRVFQQALVLTVLHAPASWITKFAAGAALAMVLEHTVALANVPATKSLIQPRTARIVYHFIGVHRVVFALVSFLLERLVQ
jgi:hypothetical protein